MEDIQFVLITGLSGAGKSLALDYFEDMGYFCVDNLPPVLIPKFAEMCMQSEGKVSKVALVCDIRGRDFFDQLFESLSALEFKGFHFEILFLEATREELVRRYKETRRMHPLKENTILDSIDKETSLLSEIRGKATNIIDTSYLNPHQFKEKLSLLYTGSERGKYLQVTIISFGYKYLVPTDADLVFDVRFLPNPHYVEQLQPLTGENTQVKEYVWKWPVTGNFFEKIEDLLMFLLPHYVREGKSHLIIAIGCTGGKHRAVVIANELFRLLQDEGYSPGIEHRDINK